jgi:TnpA family transposase
MEHWRRQYLGLETIPPELTSAEIAHFFAPDEAVIGQIRTRRAAMTRFGLILHIGFLRMTGRSLSAVERIPASVLAYVADIVGIPAPQIATLRAIYLRRATLYVHQRLATQILGVSSADDRQLRGLTAYLRRQALAQLDRSALVEEARVWLNARNFLLPGQRQLTEMAQAAQGHVLAELKETIATSVGAPMAGSWVAELMASSPDRELNVFDWLRSAISGFGTRDIVDVESRIEELRRLGAERIDLPELTVERMSMHARRVGRRKSSTLPKLKDPRRTVEIGCWLRMQLLELTDTVLDQTKRQIGKIWNKARRITEEREHEQLRHHRLAATDVIQALDDPEVTMEQFCAIVDQRLRPLAIPPLAGSKAAAIRVQMACEPLVLRALLKQVTALGLQTTQNCQIGRALATLDSVYQTKAKAGLGESIELPFPTAARKMVGSAVPGAERLAAFEVATAMLLKRGLSNGTVSAPNSIRHRPLSAQLIPPERWARSKAETVRRNRWAPSLEAHVKRLAPLLRDRLALLDATVSNGDVGIIDGKIRLPRLKAEIIADEVRATRKALFRLVGSAQLPDIMLEIDAITGFSAALLGRPPRNADVLSNICAGLLALGTEKTAADMARMLDGVSEDRIELAMRLIEEVGGLREANRRIVDAMLSCPITGFWGSGIAASADMMSLDATRHLWMSRLEPRRGTRAVGTYTHVGDQWPILYDQPVLLNKRQAGVALEGAVKQNLIGLQRLAVDTHGFTHFAMAMAKLLGFDLCPRIAGLKHRKIFLPADIAVPPALSPIVERIALGRQARAGWDGLLRLATSLKDGYGSPANIIERHGSAARGSPVFECGDTLGKLQRSVFLLDYLVNPDFRRELHRTLTQGESVHFLQRALMAGNIQAKQGRSLPQIAAISGALSLLTNIVMLWNTIRLQSVLDTHDPLKFPPEHLKHVAPVAYRHINMHGIIRFDTENWGPFAVQKSRKAEYA